METKKSVNLGTIGKIVIPESVQKTIDKLHKKIGAVEWSGALFYSLKEGEIKNLKDLVFEAKFLFPMDIGNGAYTEYDFNGDLMDAYDIYEEALELHRGHVHTHHSLSTFFSGTDTSELLDNSKYYNFYVSLIVNFDGKYCCKIAMPSATEAKYLYSIKDQNGDSIKLQSIKQEDIILVGDLIVERLYTIPEEPKDWLDLKIESLQAKKKNVGFKPAVTHKTLFDGNDFATEYKNFNKEYKDDAFYKTAKTDYKKEDDFYKMTETELLAAILADDPNACYLSIDKQIEEITVEYQNDMIDLQLLSEIMNEDFDLIFDELFPKYLSKASKKLLLEKTKKLLLSKEKLFGDCDKVFNLYFNLLTSKINE